MSKQKLLLINRRQSRGKLIKLIVEEHMKKYIYKITNLINGKVYIGQTNNPQQRWKEHCRLGALTYINNKNRHSRLYLAMKKDGIENFNFEIIEELTEEYNEKEKYWIQYYNSFLDKSKGYNLTPGGEEPPILKGEDSRLSIYSNKIIEQIQQDLALNIKSYSEISEEYQFPRGYLTKINTGETRYNESLIYPLRVNGNERKSKELVEQIIFELLYTEISIETLKRKYSIGDNAIRKINLGQHAYNIAEINYPIRQPYQQLSYYLVSEIIKDLQDNKLKLSDIEQKYNLSKSTINRINQGKKYKQLNIQYPIRSSANRVYN